MLAAALGVYQTAAHSPEEINWPGLPPRCIVTVHWHYNAGFEEFLNAHGFVPIVTARNPLDVLISILHLAKHEPATARWLCGEAGDERLLAEAGPVSPEFLQYALGPRARVLLEVSREWAARGFPVVRYEDVTADPAAVLGSLIASLGEVPAAPLQQIVADHSLDQLRRFSEHHFWRGQPGLWRALLTKEIRTAIAHRHASVFEALGYDCDAAAAPSAEEAQDAWRRLCDPRPDVTPTGG
jgi:hypothetical protein